MLILVNCINVMLLYITSTFLGVGLAATYQFTASLSNFEILKHQHINMSLTINILYKIKNTKL